VRDVVPESREGQRVPEVRFRTRRGEEWVELTSRDVFAGKTVVLFALPGAFTPTCSTRHLPGYNELAPALLAAGVDEIVCLSVNDAFVMDAWSRDQACSNVRLLPDGNAEFTAAMGMLVDKQELGFGKRSWRYSMLVRDGVIEKMFIEPRLPGDPFQVSDAETMLRYLAPDSPASIDVSIFTKQDCPHCARARRMLEQAGIPYEEIPLGANLTRKSLRAITGQETVPQVFIEGAPIGGADELEAWLAQRDSRRREGARGQAAASPRQSGAAGPSPEL
jgi:glutaredoxin-like protein